MVPRELDRLVDYLGDGRDSADQVFRAFVAYGIELEAKGNLVYAIRVGRQQIHRRGRSEGSRRGDTTGFEKFTTRETLCFLGIFRKKWL